MCDDYDDGEAYLAQFDEPDEEPFEEDFSDMDEQGFRGHQVEQEFEDEEDPDDDLDDPTLRFPPEPVGAWGSDLEVLVRKDDEEQGS